MKQIDLGTISMGSNDRKEEAASNAYAPAQTCPCCNNNYDNSAETPDGVNRYDYYYSRCEDQKSCDIGETELDAQGRILDFSMRLTNVCPGKRVAVGVVLTEVDSGNNEYPRGQKTFTVPAHNNSTCMDMDVPSMRFVMPEDISVGGSYDTCCNSRHFIARVAAHYIDCNSGSCNCTDTAAFRN